MLSTNPILPVLLWQEYTLRNCAFPQNFDTRKLGEISLFDAMVGIIQWWNKTYSRHKQTTILLCEINHPLKHLSLVIFYNKVILRILTFAEFCKDFDKWINEHLRNRYSYWIYHIMWFMWQNTIKSIR